MSVDEPVELWFWRRFIEKSFLGIFFIGGVIMLDAGAREVNLVE